MLLTTINSKTAITIEIMCICSSTELAFMTTTSKLKVCQYECHLQHPRTDVSVGKPMLSNPIIFLSYPPTMTIPHSTA